MNLNLYSIHDNIAELFNKPFTEINDGTAKRSFTQSVDKSPNKNDYTLYLIGIFDDQTGIVHPFDIPKKLMTGFEIHTPESLPQSLQNQSI